MDISLNNVLEGARQYFQGLPATSSHYDGSTAAAPLTATAAHPSGTTPTYWPPTTARGNVSEVPSMGSPAHYKTPSPHGASLGYNGNLPGRSGSWSALPTGGLILPQSSSGSNQSTNTSSVSGMAGSVSVGLVDSHRRHSQKPSIVTGVGGHGQRRMNSMGLPHASVAASIGSGVGTSVTSNSHPIYTHRTVSSSATNRDSAHVLPQHSHVPISQNTKSTHSGHQSHAHARSTDYAVQNHMPVSMADVNLSASTNSNAAVSSGSLHSRVGNSSSMLTKFHNSGMFSNASLVSSPAMHTQQSSHQHNTLNPSELLVKTEHPSGKARLYSQHAQHAMYASSNTGMTQREHRMPPAHASLIANGQREMRNTMPTTRDGSIQETERRNTVANAIAARVKSKRESPLDLSVKTVRQSADSTAKDDDIIVTYSDTHKPSNAERMLTLQLPPSIAYPTMFDGRRSTPNSAVAPKIDFMPNFASPGSNSSTSPSCFVPVENQRPRSNQYAESLPSPQHQQYQQQQLQQFKSSRQTALPPHKDPNSLSGHHPNEHKQYYTAHAASSRGHIQHHNHKQQNTSSAGPLPSLSSNHYTQSTIQDPAKSVRTSSTSTTDPGYRHEYTRAVHNSVYPRESSKRSGSSGTDYRGAVPAKVARLDWRQTDSSAKHSASSYQAQMNGSDVRGGRLQEGYTQHTQMSILQTQSQQPHVSQAHTQLQPPHYSQSYSHPQMQQQPSHSQPQISTSSSHSYTKAQLPPHSQSHTLLHQQQSYSHPQSQQSHAHMQSHQQQLQPHQQSLPQTQAAHQSQSQSSKQSQIHNPPQSQSQSSILQANSVPHSQQSHFHSLLASQNLTRTSPSSTLHRVFPSESEIRALSILRNSLENKNDVRSFQHPHATQANLSHYQQVPQQQQQQHQQQINQQQQHVQMQQHSKVQHHTASGVDLQSTRVSYGLEQLQNSPTTVVSNSQVPSMNMGHKFPLSKQVPSAPVDSYSIPTTPLPGDSAPPHQVAPSLSTATTSFHDQLPQTTTAIHVTPIAHHMHRDSGMKNTDISIMKHVSVPHLSNSPLQVPGQQNDLPNNTFNPPTTMGSGELDGIAALVAARIRTKAELKQVGSSLDLNGSGMLRPPRPPSDTPQFRSPTPASSVNSSSFHSPRTPGTPVFSPPPPNVTNQGEKQIARTPPPTPNSQPEKQPTSGGSSSGSPPKLTRERVFSPRRRLFSRTDDDTGPIAPTRDGSGPRSSSETSVFDFPDSDSEGEMPVLEMQTLDAMRRDRRSQQAAAAAAAAAYDRQQIETEKSRETSRSATPTERMSPRSERESVPEDPFWSETCEKFMEDLKTQSTTVRKRRNDKRKAAASADKNSSKNVPSKIEIEQKNETEQKIENEQKEVLQESSSDLSKKIEDNKLPNIKKEEESSEDEDIPLSKRRAQLRAEKEIMENLANKDATLDIKKEIKQEPKDPDEEASLQERKLRIRKEEKQGGKVKSKNTSKVEETTPRRETRAWSRNSCAKTTGEDSRQESEDEDADDSSSEEEDSGSDRTETVAERLRARKRLEKDVKEDPESIKLRLRSRDPSAPQEKDPEKGKDEKEETPKKESNNESPRKKSSKKKPKFGDGSDFRPGWEHDMYRFKRALRMPAQLIHIPRPPIRGSRRGGKMSASLPDLDPSHSPASSTAGRYDESDYILRKMGFRRDLTSSFERTASKSLSPAPSSRSMWDFPGSATPDSPSANSERLRRWIRLGGSQRDDSPSVRSEDSDLDSISSLRRGSAPEDAGHDSGDTSSFLNMLARKFSKQKSTRGSTEQWLNSKHRILQGSNQPELLPTPAKAGDDKKIDLASFFRKEDLISLREAYQSGKNGFVDFSPEVLTSRTRTQTKVLRQRATIREVFGEDRPASAPPSTDAKSSTNMKGRRGFLRGRPGLRSASAAVLRSNKAVLNSKKRLLRRHGDLMHVLMDNKRRQTEMSISAPAEGDPLIGPRTEPINRAKVVRRIKLRRKFRSGFDYIRKKKKQQKKDGVSEGVKEKKIQLPRPSPESVQDVQTEIKGWVINKGLGETVLHRAARHGYTDVAAYCLEKLDNIASPKDNAGYTPLHEACSRGHLDIARLLLLYGANVSESALGGIRPLHEAAENGFVELMRLLLSYGADPLLATYSGHTPVSLASDERARRLLQHHLADVQGNLAPPWNFFGSASVSDPEEIGYNPLADPPSPVEPEVQEELEFEMSEVCLPATYRLRGEVDVYVLLQDVMTALHRSKDYVLKLLGFPSQLKFKLADFLEQAHCCHFLGDRINTRGGKVVLIKYDENVKKLLGVEKITISTR